MKDPRADYSRGLSHHTTTGSSRSTRTIPVPPAFGLTPGPNAFPLETHARGLVGHLVFAVTVDAVLSLLNRTA